MAKNIEKIAAGLGAKVVGRVPDTGGGAFGAARLARIVADHPGPPGAWARPPPGQAHRCELGASSQGADERRDPATACPPGRAEQHRRPQGQPDADRRPDSRRSRIGHPLAVTDRTCLSPRRLTRCSHGIGLLDDLLGTETLTQIDFTAVRSDRSELSAALTFVSRSCFVVGRDGNGGVAHIDFILAHWQRAGLC